MTPPEQPVAIVRDALPKDLPQVQSLIEPFVAQNLLLARTEDELRTLIPHGFVAEQDGGIIGFCAVEIYSRKLAELQCLAVSSSARGQGIGRRLVEHCVERARQQGVLELMAITASESLFRACGFDYSLPDQKKALFVRPCDAPPMTS